MKCEDCQELLVEFIHRELDAARRGVLTQHLAGCGECARSCCQLQAEFDDISFALSEKPPAALRERIRGEVEKHFTPSWWRRALELVSHPIPAYGALTFAALPLVLWGVTTRSIPPSDPPAAGNKAPTAQETRVKHYDASSALGITTVLF
jgi:anti-sigma factor RsiW